MILQDDISSEVLPLATTSTVWEIILITLAMVAFSKILRWKFQMNPTQQFELQQKMQKMQDEVRLAQAQNDVQRIQEIQYEMMEYTKVIMKKQMVPMCITSIIFMSIFGVLSSVYGEYDYSNVGGMNWFLIYILVSVGANLIYSYIAKLIRKSRGIEKKAPVMDNIRALQRNISINQGAMGYQHQLGMTSNIAPSGTPSQPSENRTQKAWKKKITESEGD